MRLHIFFSLLTATVLTMNADSASISPCARFLSTDITDAGNLRHVPGQRAENETEYIPLLVRVADDNALLPDYATELHRRGSIVICTVPREKVHELASAMGVRRLEAHAASIPAMADARNFCGLPEVATMIAPQGTPYDGTGVVVGFADIGFDPNHINFSDAEGNSRIKKLVNYTTTRPTPVILTSQKEISDWTTDTNEETHATHVAGILAGYDPTGDMSGVASGADIVATTSPLYDAMMLAGCEEIISYAKSVGKPAAINISVSSDIGPHDGTTLFNQYMSSLTEEATVCISSGNEGQRYGFATATTSEKVPSARTYFREYPHLYTLLLDGTIDIWSDRAEPFTVNILMQNYSTGEIERIPVPLDVASGANQWILRSDDISAQDIPSAQMPDYIGGYIYVAAELNPENNRFNVALKCNYKHTSTTEAGGAFVLFGVEAIPPVTGTTLEFYSTPKMFFTKHHDKAPESLSSTPARAINDFCAGEGPICVGAMSSATHFTNINGEEIDFPRLNVGDVSYFSSYGTLGDGTVLPDVCAPGAQLVSSLSWYFCQYDPDYTGSLATIARERGDRTDYWGPMQGTSMSSPFTAGVAALWLQANPDLNGKDIREIAIATASAPTISENNPQWGHGILNAPEGLKEARNLAATDKVSVAIGKPVVKLSGTALHIALPSGPVANVRIIASDGRIVSSKSGDGMDEMTVDCSGCSPGIYLVEICGETGSRHCVKVAIR